LSTPDKVFIIVYTCLMIPVFRHLTQNL
jgi:hypothetical protein